jgi:hypothetical protein
LPRALAVVHARTPEKAGAWWGGLSSSRGGRLEESLRVKAAVQPVLCGERREARVINEWKVKRNLLLVGREMMVDSCRVWGFWGWESGPFLRGR